MDPTAHKPADSRSNGHASVNEHGIPRWFLFCVVGVFFGLGIFGYYLINKVFSPEQETIIGHDHEFTFRGTDFQPIYSLRSQSASSEESSGMQP